MSVATAMVRALVDATEHAGIPRSEFLERASLPPERLADDVSRFGFDEYEALQHLALDMTRDEALGLHVIEDCNEAAFDLLAQLVPRAPTLRHAIGACTQFSALLVSGSEVVLEERLDVARIRYAFRRLSPRVNRLHAEVVIAGLFRMLQVFGGKSTRLRRASFEHAAPEYRVEYRRVFGGAEVFAQPFSGLEFDRALLDVPHFHQQPRLFALLRAEAVGAVHALTTGRDHVLRVEQYLRTRVRARVPNMHVVARALGMSARSLRRRLAEEGTTFRDVVHARLREIATDVLRSPGSSVQQAARSTGFSDSAAFHRAFKQWTGMTPTDFQRRAHRVTTVTSGPG